jgi:uncharacterized damage-inducible protein DinB
MSPHDAAQDRREEVQGKERLDEIEIRTDSVQQRIPDEGKEEREEEDGEATATIGGKERMQRIQDRLLLAPYKA